MEGCVDCGQTTIAWSTVDSFALMTPLKKPVSSLELQFMTARILALESAGDALTKMIPKGSAKSDRAIKIWKLTKIGGKRADKK
jgi:hypothetical protein